MIGGSSIVVFVLGMAMMFTLLYFSITYSHETNTIPIARITQDESILIADSDLKQRLPEYKGIVGIVDPSWSRYVPLAEFEQKRLDVPLIYVPPNGTLLMVTEAGYEKRGACDTSLLAYCGWMEDKYNFDYGSRLVYGVELQIDSQEALAMYMIDATNGRIVDSTFLRSDWIHAHTDEEESWSLQ
ncbi:MAG TPA: hypothetical protein VJP79_07180 [Nitrososphaera sp.]|nr:hypothetical protein [Nitrososphaera sp.]